MSLTLYALLGCQFVTIESAASPDAHLPIPMWLPFTITARNAVFWSVIFYEQIALNALCFLHGGIDSFSHGCFTSMLYQAKVLCHRLSILGYEDGDDPHVNINRKKKMVEMLKMHQQVDKWKTFNLEFFFPNTYRIDLFQEY